MTEEECTLEEHGKWMSVRDDCPKCHKKFTQDDKDEYYRSLMDELGDVRVIPAKNVPIASHVNPQIISPQSHEAQLILDRRELVDDEDEEPSNVNEDIAGIQIDISRLQTTVKLHQKIISKLYHAYLKVKKK